MMDSDDEREEIPSWKGIPGIIVLINVFDPLNQNIAAVAHAATCRMVRQHLRVASSHNVGVCLYGTEDAGSSAVGNKSVIDIFPLSPPTLDDFKKLRNTDISTYSQVKDYKLSDVLWHCSKMFANCKKQLSSRTVIMLTCLDTPPVAADQKPTLKRVVDLVDANIDIRIINISPNDYEIDPFYNNFLIEANKGKDLILPKTIWNCKEIEQVMHRQSHRHLAVTRLNFEIGNELLIGVGVYNLLIKSVQYQQKKVNLDRDSNAILTSVTKTMKITTDTLNSDLTAPMDVDEAENETRQMPLLKSELLHYVKYGDERIEFTDSEMKKLKNPFGPPVMKLLGFKPASIVCKEKWYLKSGYFLFPNENIIEGSTVVFKALHQACTEMSTVAICVLCTRVNAKPYIVALSPCTHPLGLDVEIGFDVIQIPFVENLRDIPAVDEEGTNTSEEHNFFIKDMLKSLQFDYKPEMFENPKMQSQYRAIEAIALEEDDMDPFIDTTKPDTEKFKSIQEDLFQELFGPFETVAPKRVTSSKELGANSKRAKVEDLDDTLLRDRIKYRTVHQFTVAQLRGVLKSCSNTEIPALNGMKKNDLVDLVYKYCSSYNNL